MPSPALGRRELLLGLGAATVLAACEVSSPIAGPSRDHGRRWPGHRPGRVYLGMSYPGDIADAEAVTGPVGVHRSFYQWDDLAREAEVIGDDHANGRLPWVSFKPPSRGGWARDRKSVV